MDQEHLDRARQEALNRFDSYPRWQQTELRYLEEKLAEREAFWRRLRPRSGSVGTGDQQGE